MLPQTYPDPPAHHKQRRHAISATTSALNALRRLSPRASARTQLVAAALMWLIGASILLVRGFGYLQTRYWHAWALAAGLVLGVFKARMLLIRVAHKAVARIRARGTAHFFGFFSARSWGLLVLMMGGGMTLRRLVVDPDVLGAGIMGAIYIGVGTALALADRVFWRAVFDPQACDAPPDDGTLDTPSAEDLPAPIH